jgi:hypothetical protein
MQKQEHESGFGTNLKHGLQEGWVGCKTYPMNKVIKHNNGKYMEI